MRELCTACLKDPEAAQYISSSFCFDSSDHHHFRFAKFAWQVLNRYKMPRETRRLWFAPASMLGALIAGIAFAAGHHLFYRRLNGRTVSTGSFLGWSSVSEQEANIAIGTAFAYLVKACIGYAISVAFIQAFWREAGVRRQARGAILADLDWIFSALDDMLSLFNFPLWLKYPTLLLTATSAWCVSISENLS